MEQNMNDPKLAARRDFLKSAGVTAAGLCLAGADRLATGQESATAAKSETLAVNGGKPAVSFPAAKQGLVFAWPQYGAKEKKAVLEALDLGQSGFYNCLPELEIKWQKYNGVPFAKSHMNGTSALLSMYFAMNLPAGSEIMVPSYTFFGTITTMRFFGCVPVFVDINPRTATFDLEHAKKVMNPRVRAMVPMHSWGLPCEMDHICDFAKEHGLDVLEDCAHAHGASMQGKKVAPGAAWASIASNRPSRCPVSKAAWAFIKNARIMSGRPSWATTRRRPAARPRCTAWGSRPTALTKPITARAWA